MCHLARSVKLEHILLLLYAKPQLIELFCSEDQPLISIHAVLGTILQLFKNKTVEMGVCGRGKEERGRSSHRAYVGYAASGEQE